MHTQANNMERKIIICAVVAMSLLMLLNSIVGLSSAQEKSTEKTIIWIHNVYELQNMSKNLSGNYALANDIDATITKTWNNGSGFVPIGNYNNRFGGTFDGKGYKIINLYINRSSQNDVGLFGYTSKYAVIENVGLVNVSVSGNYDVGGLVGWNYYGTVSNSYATGNVSGNYAVGGFVGENYGTVAASFWDVNTSGINHSDGGTGKTTEEMKNKTTFLNADWDFTNIWDIVDGQTYPFFKWQTPSKPSSPRYLHATAGDGYVNLTWTNPSFDGASPITEYRIYRNGVLIKTVSATQLWFNDTTVENGQTYTYYVTAVNAAGESPKSNEVQATPGGNIPEMSIWLIGIIAIVLLFAKRRR